LVARWAISASRFREIEDIGYDFKRKEYVNTKTGKPLGPAAFKKPTDSGGGARASKAGDRSLKRAAIIASIIRGESEGQSVEIQTAYFAIRWLSD
jgi:hypothetical protein